MEKFIVVVFDKNEAKAFEALRAIEELDKIGEISVYDAQIVVKTPSGLARVIDEDDNRAFAFVGGGGLVGALIGLLGGPVGALVGAAAGALTGSIGDIEMTGVTDDFVNDVSKALKVGKVAVIADIDEDWVTPLDTRMEELGGVLFRRIRSVVKTSQHDRDAVAYQAEMDQLKAERKQARAERLAKIDAKIDQLRTKLEAAIERKRAKMQAHQQERKAKIKALEVRASQTQGEIRSRQENRIAALRKEYAEKAAAK